MKWFRRKSQINSHALPITFDVFATDVSCRAWTELVTDYIDGTLDATMRHNIDRHLAECRGCVAYLEQLRMTIRSAGCLNQHDVSTAMPTELRTALLQVFHEPAS